MAVRLDLQALLESLEDGVNIYFQPPANVTMSYPAIVYNRDYASVHYADNHPYSRMIRWQLTVIDPNPDSLIPDKVAMLPLTTYVRHYTTENLNHDIFNIYF
jgi:hypothetical protein